MKQETANSKQRTANRKCGIGPVSCFLFPVSCFLFPVLLLACGVTDPIDNEPPQVPRLPHIERLEVDRFRLSWNAPEDDATPPAALRYNVGLVESDVCVAVAPSFATQGVTQIDIALPDEVGEEPFVGFTVRSVDETGDSRGYGPCVWGLRSPVPIPVEIPARAPRMRPDPQREDRPDCRPDGSDGVWCLGEGEVDHLGGADWQSLPLPVPFDTTAWSPLGPYAVVLHSQRVQLHLSRANGVQAFALSAGSEYFDAGSGALPGVGGGGFLVVRGFLAELRRRHLDLMGPPMTIGLPDRCRRVVQLAHQDDLALALCRDGEQHLLFSGEMGARVLWTTAPLEVPADRIESGAGTRESGIAGLTGPTGAWVVTWGAERGVRAVEGLPGRTRPALAVAGQPEQPLVIAAEGETWLRRVAGEMMPLPVDSGHVDIDGHLVPAGSALIGAGESGIYAVSEAATARITATGVPLFIAYGRHAWGLRGADGRHYFVREPAFTHVLSSNRGDDWFVHPWRGPELDPVSLAVTPAGGLFVSGWRTDATAPGGRTAMLARLGEEAVDIGTGGQQAPPLLAADLRGHLYAASAAGVTWREMAGMWEPMVPIPVAPTAMIGLAEGVVIRGTTDRADQWWTCRQSECAELRVPEAQPGRIQAVVRHAEGFCAAVHPRGLWCSPEERWFDLRLGAEQMERHGLGANDAWTMLDAVRAPDGAWLLALRSGRGGLLAEIAAGGEARVVAAGLHWADGAVVLEPDESGFVFVLSPEGPARLRFTGEGAALPDLLYP